VYTRGKSGGGINDEAFSKMIEKTIVFGMTSSRGIRKMITELRHLIEKSDQKIYEKSSKI
jgi:hypothetical protein